jgi:hypothetical protein
MHAELSGKLSLGESALARLEKNGVRLRRRTLESPSLHR